jgi:nucleotide-binding universal stress UspA family protein
MHPPNAGEGPVLFAYDGSEHAGAAVEQAGSQLRTGRRALVLVVLEPIGRFAGPASPLVMPQEVTDQLAAEAVETAARGAELVRGAGFDAEPLVEEGSPTWATIVAVAEREDAAVVVIGSHGRSGLAELTMGSVATAVAHHLKRPLLIAHLRSD